MNDTKLAFLKEIRKNPVDNLPRLVYADWLEEHGEPEYAEYIRFAIENELGASLHPYRTQLERDIYGMLNTVVRPRSPRWGTLELDRGFLSSVNILGGVEFKRYVPIYVTQCLTSIPYVSPIFRDYTLIPSPCFIGIESIPPMHRKLLTPALMELANAQGGWTITESRLIPHGADDPAGRISYEKCRQLTSDAAILTLKRLAHESV